jgi:hypothetical protein
MAVACLLWLVFLTNLVIASLSLNPNPHNLSCDPVAASKRQIPSVQAPVRKRQIPSVQAPVRKRQIPSVQAPVPVSISVSKPQCQSVTVSVSKHPSVKFQHQAPAFKCSSPCSIKCQGVKIPISSAEAIMCCAVLCCAVLLAGCSKAMPCRPLILPRRCDAMRCCLPNVMRCPKCGAVRRGVA